MRDIECINLTLIVHVPHAFRVSEQSVWVVHPVFKRGEVYLRPPMARPIRSALLPRCLRCGVMTAVKYSVVPCEGGAGGVRQPAGEEDACWNVKRWNAPRNRV